ncbi:MAG: hypothetical protein WA987_02080 [Cellvibrio sp.]|jgi:hypothetical protein
MVYIGPINTLSLTAKTKAVKGYSSEENMPVNKPVDSTMRILPMADRRKTPDRRRQQRDPMVETRAGGDRRKRPRIDVEV